MNKKRKFGILLILIGFGIPLVLFFFQDDGDLNMGNPTYKVIERELTSNEIDWFEEKISVITNISSVFEKWLRDNDRFQDLWFASYDLEENLKESIKKSRWTIESKLILVIPYKYFVGIGVLLIFIGMGMIIFSFFPKVEIKEEKKEIQTE